MGFLLRWVLLRFLLLSADLQSHRVEFCPLGDGRGHDGKTVLSLTVLFRSAAFCGLHHLFAGNTAIDWDFRHGAYSRHRRHVALGHV